jgi:myo-inositol-1(or 4)-monophosphatase
MASSTDPLAADWLSLCRRAAEGLRGVLIDHPTTLQRAVETGRGEGGDLSLVIDRDAEEVVFSLLEELHGAGHRFIAISEERGEVDFGGGPVRVVIDPIDGSLNAKRGLPPHALSVAVADGPTMADVAFGYVHDFGTGEEWRAERGAGAHLNDLALDTTPRERRTAAGRLEVVGIESAHPRWVAARIDGLLENVYRLRAMGSIALTMCQVAGARLDGMLSLSASRGVDSAAAQLIVREGGGLVAFPMCETPLGAPLDLTPRSPVVAARTAEGLAELASVVAA